MALIGLCSGCSGTLSMFATPTDRTSGFLQAILGSFVIPITVCGVQWCGVVVVCVCALWRASG